MHLEYGSMTDKVKSSFVIFDIQALRRSELNVRSECPNVKNYKWRLKRAE